MYLDNFTKICYGYITAERIGNVFILFFSIQFNYKFEYPKIKFIRKIYTCFLHKVILFKLILQLFFFNYFTITLIYVIDFSGKLHMSEFDLILYSL